MAQRGPAPCMHITASSFRLHRTSSPNSLVRDPNVGLVRLQVSLPDARPATAKSASQSISSDVDTITFPDFSCSWSEPLKRDDGARASSSSDFSADGEMSPRDLIERSLKVSIIGRFAKDKRVSFFSRIRGKTERVLGACSVDLWTAATGPVHHNLSLRALEGRDTPFRLEFHIKVIIKEQAVFRLRDVTVDLQYPTSNNDRGGGKVVKSSSNRQEPEPYIVLSFAGMQNPTAISQEKLLPTSKPRWAYVPLLEIPALSISELVSGYILAKVHDARNRNKLLTSFKIPIHSYWGCVLSQGREVRVAVSTRNNTLTGNFAVERAPRIGQMYGGMHSDDGITDGRPLVFGIPLPLSRRRDDTVWGTRTPVPQGWIELLDSFGYVYYHNVANRFDSWLEPGHSPFHESDEHTEHKQGASQRSRDGSNEWIHPRARRLQRLTLISASSRNLRLLSPSASTSILDDSVSTVGGLQESEVPQLQTTSSPGRRPASSYVPKLVDENGIMTEMRWTNLDTLFARRLFPGAGTEGHSLSLIDNGRTILKFGGAGVGGFKNNDLFAFDTRDMLWRPVRASGVAPTPCTAHGAVTLGDGSRVLIFGGASRRGRLNDLHVLDTECWKWSNVLPTSQVSPSPRARLGMTGMPNGTSAVLFGGREGYRYLGDRYYNDVWVFDAYRTEWLNVKASNSKVGPAPRSGCVTEMINGRQLFVHAGYDDGDRFYGDSWLLDTVSWEWQQLPYPNEPHRPIPREGHASTVIGDTVFIYGGDRENGGYLSDVHMFDSGSLRWVGEPMTTGASPGGRCGAAMAPVDNHRLLVVGGDNGFCMASDTHTLDTVYTAKAHVEEVTQRVRNEGPHASSCIICLDSEAEAVFLWCGHFVCCRACAARVKNRCPLCRRWISKVSLVEK